jgi:arginyl-tRNA synthetase
MEKVRAKIQELMASAGVAGEIDLSIPPKPEMGDLAFACFDEAKRLGKNPAALSVELASKISASELVAKTAPFGPYLNFFLKPAAVAGLLLGEIIKQNDNYGQSNQGAKRRVLVEYPSNNTHKELHIGHLRNICIGNSLVELYRANGYETIPINYINDFGAHVAKCLWGYLKFHAKDKAPANKQKWLGEIYAEASQYLKDHPDEKEDVARLQIKLEQSDKSIWPLYSKTRKWSLEQFTKVFKELGVRHKKTFFEKDIKSLGQKVVDELLKKGVAKTGEGGAVIVDLSDYGLDIGLLRKSDGAGLYLTADLGLALVKNKYFPGIYESVHLTGSEQNFYFKQLFKVLELAGYKFKPVHIGYGLVNLASGKMSSRAGNVILYDDVWKTVYEKTVEETSMRHKDWQTKKTAKTARQIALAAIKFDFLKHESSRNIIFDPNGALSFEGFTGPYVLYAVARINSILRKKKLNYSKADFSLLTAPEEKQLVLAASSFDVAVNKAMANRNPSVIAKYAFDLAKLYGDFYAKHSVLGAGSSGLVKARLALSFAVKTVLVNALNLLAIEPVNEM